MLWQSRWGVVEERSTGSSSHSEQHPFSRSVLDSLGSAKVGKLDKKAKQKEESLWSMEQESAVLAERLDIFHIPKSVLSELRAAFMVMVKVISFLHSAACSVNHFSQFQLSWLGAGILETIKGQGFCRRCE